jgi:primosomal replication protein N''
MIRFCPRCETERPVTEFLCEGEFRGEPCHWDLAAEPIRQEGGRPTDAQPEKIIEEQPLRCVNDHPMEVGELLCSVCGADRAHVNRVQDQVGGIADQPSAVTQLGQWRFERSLLSRSGIYERFLVTHVQDGRQGVLTLYCEGRQPDQDVYEVLKTLDRDHIPEIFEAGRWDDRAYEVSEYLTGGTLADVGLLPNDHPTLSRILSELANAVHALGERGLRHRDLRPDAILLRARDPLDLVVTEFGSARLSDFDLDIVSALETTRYSAPETVAGGVAAASDWWSLGMMLLEQVTQGECFAGSSEQAFLIHVIAKGAPIPEGLDPAVELLLRGLLARDRRERWGWSEVQSWLSGERPAAPMSSGAPPEAERSSAIQLGTRSYRSVIGYTLAAAGMEHWDSAKSQLLRGEIATWLRESGFDQRTLNELRQSSQLPDLSEDLKLTVALKLLNPEMPLVCRGEIVGPAWLLKYPDDGYALLSGPAPEFLERLGSDPWVSRMRARAAKVRERAKHLNISIVEQEFEVHVLSSSRATLSAIWADRRRLLPDTDHPGLAALLERRQSEDEDLILLLSADVSHFRSADVIIADASVVAERAGLSEFDAQLARDWLQVPRRELFAELERRLGGFARCGFERIDEWADQFRLERRLPIERALILVSLSPTRWVAPPKQTYVATLLDFFAKRITASVMRGALTRMVIGKTTARLDLTELHSRRRPAQAILEHLLLRNEQMIDLDPEALSDPRVESRLRRLHGRAELYRRDTGIDGLYLGFPFLLLQEANTSTRPRIAPVILWPVKLKPELGARASASISSGGEAVRLNPAFQPLLGTEVARQWQEATNELLGRASLTLSDVMEAFASLVSGTSGAELGPLPGRDATAKVGEPILFASAALFHLEYRGQAVLEDMRQLRGIPPAGTGLEAALRVGEPPAPAEINYPREIERFFTAASDPSQERAVFEARHGAGLLIEGPPGTGKSQTIVNLVCDAIGRKRSVLIVCQKQAALDVVNKRLVAEGLGDRLLKIDDVTSDRQPTIRAIREQVASVFARTSGAASWKNRRQELAARIESLEGDLDRHHRALHAEDSHTGLSYRNIIGDLALDAEGQRLALEVPALRESLGTMTAGAVSSLQEDCGPLAANWLSSGFEDSALHVLLDFVPNADSITQLRQGLEAFVAAETNRIRVWERTEGAARVSSAEPFRTWLAAHADVFLEVPDHRREQLARWSELFKPDADALGHEILNRISKLRASFASAAPEPNDSTARTAVQKLQQPELLEWKALCERLSLRKGWFAAFSPSRWMGVRRLRRFLKKERIAAEEVLRAELHHEYSVRPLRAQLAEVESALSEPARQIQEASLLQNREALHRLESSFQQVADLAARLCLFPDRKFAFSALGAGSREKCTRALTAVSNGCMRLDAAQQSEEALRPLGAWFRPEWMAERLSAIQTGEPNARAVLPVLNELTNVKQFQHFRRRSTQLRPEVLSTFARLRVVDQQLRELPPAELGVQVRKIIGREARLAWKERLEADNPILMLDDSELEAKREALVAADTEFRDLNKRQLVDGIDATQLRPNREWEQITRLTGHRSKRLREFLDAGIELGLTSLRPVWLMNPDVASRVLPLRKGLFDVVIYDEASQIPIEYAVPTLFRSRSLIVSGDEKQMPPTAFFSSKVESEEADFDDADEGEAVTEAEREEIVEAWNRKEIKDCPDLLQLAKSVLPTTTLQIHYRSAYRELIQFSNAAFYSGGLSVPVRHPDTEIQRVRPIELVKVDGRYEGQSNKPEAKKVIEVLAEFWKAPKESRKSVGIVTFNRKQADLIDDLLEEVAETDLAFRLALAEERERNDGGEDMSFFVKNVENVQGDERDVIIFSSAFGRNSQGTFRRHFGVLGQSGGERRLNVAVTRARERVVMVTSMPIPLISDFLNRRGKATTPREHLHAYLAYADALSEGNMTGARALLQRVGTSGQATTRSDRIEDDGFQRVVREFIINNGWTPHASERFGAFGLDFAIEDPRTGLYAIGIECDSPRDPLLGNARAREGWRPKLLGRSVPHIHRVSSKAWFSSADSEKAKLRQAILRALS